MSLPPKFNFFLWKDVFADQKTKDASNWEAWISKVNPFGTTKAKISKFATTFELETQTVSMTEDQEVVTYIVHKFNDYRPEEWWKRVPIDDGLTRSNSARLAEGILGEGSFGTVSLEQCYEKDKYDHKAPLKKVYVKDIHGKLKLKRRAVKEIPSSKLAKDPLAELETLVNLSERYKGDKDAHPYKPWVQCFAQIQGYWWSNTSLHIAVEYFPLGDLSHYLNYPLEKKSVAEHIVGKIIHQLTVGLALMHEDRAHRDIKPENIMVEDLESYVSVRISDFGLCKIVREGTIHTPVGFHLPEYNAPEIFKLFPPEEGSGNLSDEALHAYLEQRSKEGYTYSVDCWSVGVLAFQLLTKKLPFTSMGSLSLYVNMKDPKGFIEKKLVNAFDQMIDDDDQKGTKLSRDAIDFIKTCLIPDGRIRPDAGNLIKAPWFGRTLWLLH